MLTSWGNEGTEMLTVPRGQRRQPLRACGTLQRSHCLILLTPALLAGMSLGGRSLAFQASPCRDLELSWW